METCLYKGKQLCSFDLLNEKGYKNLELESTWKRYAEKKLLICEECKEIVYLRSGEKKVPHFYHKPNSLTNCSKKVIVSEEYLSAKKNLYLIFKKNSDTFQFQMNIENKFDFQVKYLNKIYNIILKKIDELENLIYLENMENYYFYGDINSGKIQPLVNETNKIIKIISENNIIVFKKNTEIKKYLLNYNFFLTNFINKKDIRIFQIYLDAYEKLIENGFYEEAKIKFLELKETLEDYDVFQLEKDNYIFTIESKLGEIYENLEDYPNAINIYEKHQAIKLKDYIYTYKLLYLYEKAHDYNKLLNIYTELINNGENYYKERGMLYMNKFLKEKEAFEDFFQIEDTLPPEITPLYNQLKNKYYKEIISLPIQNSIGDLYWIKYNDILYPIKKDNLKKPKHIISLATNLIINIEINKIQNIPILESAVFDIEDEIIGIVKEIDYQNSSLYVLVDKSLIQVSIRRSEIQRAKKDKDIIITKNDYLI